MFGGRGKCFEESLRAVNDILNEIKTVTEFGFMLLYATLACCNLPRPIALSSPIDPHINCSYDGILSPIQ